MILCDLDGTVVEGSTSPSDTAAHAYIYRNMPEVNGVVHTHLTLCDRVAARGEKFRIRGAINTTGQTSSAGTSWSAPFAIIATIRSDAALSQPLTGSVPLRSVDAKPWRSTSGSSPRMPSPRSWQRMRE
jgi:L-ribulose-5-phosphate 4-epimerase